MTEYVFANVEGTATVLYAPTGAVELHAGEVWPADDPFVQARKDLFSTVPTVVHSTTGAAAPQPQPLAAPKRRRRG